jgi:tRNA(fMet)-specific endonuclease VapC
VEAVSLVHLLDTNIASYYLRRSSAALEARVNEGLLRGTVALSVLTRAELRFGQAGMSPDDRRRSLIDHFLMQLPCLPWTSQAADQYGALKGAQRRSGTPIGELDTQIAAHALAEGLTLVTHNTRHFALVPGLKLEDWFAEPTAPAKPRRRKS